LPLSCSMPLLLPKSNSKSEELDILSIKVVPAVKVAKGLYPSSAYGGEFSYTGTRH